MKNFRRQEQERFAEENSVRYVEAINMRDTASDLIKAFPDGPLRDKAVMVCGYLSKVAEMHEQIMEGTPLTSMELRKAVVSVLRREMDEYMSGKPIADKIGTALRPIRRDAGESIPSLDNK